MAGDLIPPPSPAGRPDPDAGRTREPGDNEEFLARATPVAAEVAPEPVADELVAPAVETPYRSRFGFIMGALVGVGLAVLVVVVLVATRSDGSGGPTWSAWKPSSKDRLEAAAEIAAYIGARYRLDDGSQLATVQSGPIELNDIPLTVVVRTAGKGGNIEPILGDGIWYVLNGLGERGSISKGEPSVKRGALVERQALELSLYTFRYVKGVDHVVTILPPPRTEGDSASSSASGALSADSETPPRAILFRPGDLKPALEAPLSVTLPATPPMPGEMSDQESDAYQSFTADNVFEMSVVSSQIGQGFLVLDRPSTPTKAEELVQSAIGKKP